MSLSSKNMTNDVIQVGTKSRDVEVTWDCSEGLDTWKDIDKSTSISILFRILYEREWKTEYVNSVEIE